VFAAARDDALGVDCFSGRSVEDADALDTLMGLLLNESSVDFNLARRSAMATALSCLVCERRSSDMSEGVVPGGFVTPDADVFCAPGSEWTGNSAVRCRWLTVGELFFDVSPSAHRYCFYCYFWAHEHKATGVKMKLNKTTSTTHLLLGIKCTLEGDRVLLL